MGDAEAARGVTGLRRRQRSLRDIHTGSPGEPRQRTRRPRGRCLRTCRALVWWGWGQTEEEKSVCAGWHGAPGWEREGRGGWRRASPVRTRDRFHGTFRNGEGGEAWPADRRDTSEISNNHAVHSPSAERVTQQKRKH